jgi:hypothetical protein
MTKKAYEIEKEVTKVKKVLTELIRDYGFYHKDRGEDDYRDMRAKAVYFICLELEELGLDHTQYVRESYQEKVRHYKGGETGNRDSYVLKIIGKKIDDNFRLAIKNAYERLARRLEIKKKQKEKYTEIQPLEE